MPVNKHPLKLIRACWTVYLVRCANGAFYTGITNRLKERIKAHNSGAGAKYTAAFGPVRLVWRRKSKNRSSASKLEAGIKKLTRAEKITLIKSGVWRRNFPAAE
jgi:putative endonuclease